MQNYQKNLIHYKKSTRDSLVKLNEISEQYPHEPLALFVVDDKGKCIGTITDGDVRRCLVSGLSIESPVSEFMNTDFHFLREDSYGMEDAGIFCQKNIKLVPVLDHKNRVAKIHDLTTKKSLLPLDAVIMAGGKGTRLKPLTNNTPKPLLKIGEKPIIEYNIDRLNQFGIDNLFLTVNYLGEQLVEYFGDGSIKEMNIQYVHENKPLGTIGALSLINEFRHDHVLLMNSDLLTTIDFHSFFLDFKSKGADMAVASVPYEVKVPYAILDVNGDGIKSFKEKPELTYYSNAGIYIIKTELLDRIKKNEFRDVTDFMEELIEEGKKISYFPLLGYWLDIGKHEDFKKAQKDIKLLDL